MKMSLTEHLHRPIIPTVEEILSDFDSLKNSKEIDPLLAVFNDKLFEPLEIENDQEREKNSREKEVLQRRKEICDTYKKVAEFLEQNENLTKSIASVNNLSKELCLKKVNLTQLILNIKQNMEGGYEN